MAVEIDPTGLDRARIKAFAEAGVTRASLGVQDVHLEVQCAVYCIRPYEARVRAVDRLRAGTRAASVAREVWLVPDIEVVVLTVEFTSRKGSSPLVRGGSFWLRDSTESVALGCTRRIFCAISCTCNGRCEMYTLRRRLTCGPLVTAKRNNPERFLITSYVV